MERMSLSVHVTVPTQRPVERSGEKMASWKTFSPLKLQFSDGFADPALQYRERDGGEVLLFYREVQKRRSAVRFLQNRYQLDCFYNDGSHESYTFTMRHMV